MTMLQISNRFQKNLEDAKLQLIDRALEKQDQEAFMQLTKQGDEWISYVLEKMPHFEMLATCEVEDVVPSFEEKKFNLYLDNVDEEEREFHTLEEYAEKTLVSDDKEEIKKKIQYALDTERIPPENEIENLLDTIIQTPELLEKTILVTDHRFRGFGIEVSPISFGLILHKGYEPIDGFSNHPSDEIFSANKVIEFLKEKVTVIPIALNRRPKFPDTFKDLFN